MLESETSETERPQLRFELHYDESVFGSYENLVISASLVDQPEQFNQLETDFQETKFVSNIF